MNWTNDSVRDDERSRHVAGTVASLHIAPAGDVPMTALPMAQVVAGRGIVGDRYYLRRGRDAAYDQLTCDVTLIEQETIEAMKQQDPSIEPGASARRNIVVRDCDLSHLVGRTFRIGEVTLQGLARRDSEEGASESIKRADPHECTTPAGYCLVLPRPDLRAMVLTGGTISVGDSIEVL